jgi:deoxycytidylate deaminase
MAKRPRGADLVLKAVASPTRPFGIAPEESSQEDKDGVAPLSTPKRRLDMPSPMASPVDDASPSAQEPAAASEPCTRTTKRTDYLKWDDYFMAVAVLSAHRSKGDFWRALTVCSVFSPA